MEARSASFPGTLDSLSAIGAFTLEAAAEAGIGAHATYRLRLAVDEVATNIIVHGYTGAGRTGMVILRVYVVQDSLLVELEDTGAPYDVESSKFPTAEELSRPLEERAVGGLGIFLITQSVDVFHHESAGAKNRTILGIRCHQTEHERGEGL
jgi:anti-sigma regulatory factor (Ser/Thr protein kinase)